MRAVELQPTKLAGLTSLRFFAALLVVFHHTVPREQIEWLPLVGTFCLDHGVSFFFVLSGFILTHVYLDRETGWREFFVARIARVWPAHVAALLLGIALGIYSIGAFWRLPLNLALLHSWLPVQRSYFAYNAVSWSVSTELAFYLLFPLLISDFRRTWWWKLGGSLLLVAGVIACCEWLQVPGESAGRMAPTRTGLLCIWPVSRLFEFVLGMCVCLFFKRTCDAGGSRWLWTCAECGIVVLAVANACSLRFLWGTNPSLNEYLLHSSSSLSLAGVILVFAFGRGLVSATLRWTALVFLGEISYSIYLLHMLIFSFLLGRCGGSFITAHMIFWPVLLCAAALNYRFVEAPMRGRLKGWLSRRPKADSASHAECPLPHSVSGKKRKLLELART